MIDIRVHNVICPHCGVNVGMKTQKTTNMYFEPGKPKCAQESYSRCYSCKKSFLMRGIITVDLHTEALEVVEAEDF